MTTVYQLTAKSMDGYIELAYSDGILNRIEMVLKTPLSDEQFRVFVDTIEMEEKEISFLSKLGLTVTPLMAANQKIALFCEKYEEYKGLKYKASRQDGGKIKQIRIDSPMLDAYFGSDNFLFKNKHSVSNLVKYYNELLAEIAGAGKSKHPNTWNEVYYKKLSIKECGEYFAHLNSLGFKAVKDGVGNLREFIKPAK